jgi:hypothetical protein
MVLGSGLAANEKPGEPQAKKMGLHPMTQHLPKSIESSFSFTLF